MWLRGKDATRQGRDNVVYSMTRKESREDGTSLTATSLVGLGFADSRCRIDHETMVRKIDRDGVAGKLRPHVSRYVYENGELRLYELSKWNTADPERSADQPDLWINYGGAKSQLGVNHLPILAADGYLPWPRGSIEYGDLGRDFAFSAKLELVERNVGMEGDATRSNIFRYTSRDGADVAEYWVDTEPSKCAALNHVSFYYSGAKIPQLDFKILHAQSDNGDWRPHRWTLESRDDNGKLTKTREYAVNELSFGRLEPDFFAVPLQPGDLIYDTGTRSRLMVADDNTFVPRPPKDS